MMLALNMKTQIIFILAVAIPGLCQTQIETGPQTVTVSLGDTAQLPCKVNNLQTSQTVIWHFVDHNQTISSGNNIQAGIYEQKYSIFRPQDADGFWNLEIFGVGLSDKGSYKCYVSGMENQVQVVHHLEISEAPESPPAPDLNVTDCCITEGVEQCALPLCDTSTSIIDLLGIVANDQCMTDNVIKVLRCGQDGRNHLGCCMRRGFTYPCLNLCSGYGEVDGTDYNSCINPVKLSSLVQCFKEGNVMLPSPPTGVSAINTGTEVVVNWGAPAENADVVAGYKVQYKKKGELLFNSTRSLAPNVYMEIVRNLELNEVYEIQVIATATSGGSQPSLPVFIATKGVIPPANYTTTIGDCCVKQNITAGCQGFCNASLYYTGGHPNILQCDAQLNVIYKCIAGHGDHTPCCKRVQVPDVCSGLCRGEPILNWSMVQCLSYMPLISSCIIEGSLILPDPPKNARVLAETVTADSAVVSWEAPDNMKPGDYYQVSWRIDKVQIYNWTTEKVLSGTKFEITGLEATTLYDVVVVTVNDYGSSLPELTLVLITEGVSNVPVTPYNETECCMDKGVTGNCLKLCQHEFRISDQATLIALTCPDAIVPMLICGTDGRDHTTCCNEIQNLPPKCLPLCSLHPESTPSVNFLECALYKNELSNCFDQGKAIFPRPPQELTVKKIDLFSIVLDWEAPTGPNITNYTVEYTLDTQYWMKIPSTNHTFSKVANLTSDTTYSFRVTSNNAVGHSTPIAVTANTLAATINKTEVEWMQLWKDREECCQKSNISSECQNSCVSGINDDFDSRICSGDIDKIIACGADGRDHSGCCKKNIPEFSPTCLPYCQGQPGSRDLESALCLTYLGPILTCFSEGQGLLPPPPQLVKARALSSTEILMKWAAPSSNCNSSCYYVTYIWEESSKDMVQKNQTNGNSFTFSGLKPVTTYRVAAAATNKNGMSLPSPYFLVRTPSESPHTVSVSQAPAGVVDKGTAVQLECVGLGADIYRVNWIRNNKNVSDENLYLIKELSEKDQGSYRCKITFADLKVLSAGLYLNVRYIPVAKKMLEKTVLPGVGQDAKLLCEFEGFPDIVTWSKDSNTLQGGSKYSMPTLTTDLTAGKTISYLIVRNVVSADFGSYTCTGLNKFGKMHSTGSLRNLFPVTPAPTSAPPSNTSMSECCRSKGVPDDCARHICSFTIDINNIITDASLTHCALYLTDFFTCAADGKDHSKCCTEKGVQEYCMPFCAGVVPDHDNQLELLQCMPYADTLINCVTGGMKYIPSQPRNVHVQVLYDTLRVIWDPPEKNADKVNVYHIFYESNSLKQTFDAASSQSRSKDLQADLIKKGETYTVWVVAINDFGSSLLSENATVKVSGLVPPAPSNLHGTPLPDISIDVTWEPPTTKLKVLKYAVHFQSDGGQTKKVNPIKPSTRLIDLSPNTKYLISVAAVSSDGEGPRTNVIRVTTVGSKTNVKPSPQSQNGNKTVGIAVGVVLGLVFLITIGVVAILLYRRLGKPKLTGSQTVAFENPQYASGQRVTGLPGEGESNKFNYGKLHEEHDSEHAYMTMEDPHSDSTDTPATLDLDQA